MKNFFETLKNIWSIKELRDKILFTLVAMAIFRFGSYVVLPGVNYIALESAADSRGANDLLKLINTFTGGAFNQGSIFALGIMPYITASIIVQLLGFAVPYFQKLQQKEGESGRKRLNQITRFLTLFITLVQGGGYLAYLKSTPGAVDTTVPEGVFWFSNMIILSTGTIFAMWLGEKITDKGIGNGISLLIMVGIIAGLPAAFFSEVLKQFNSNIILLILELAFFLLVVLATILVVQAVRKIPIQAAKKMVGRSTGSVPSAGARDFINLKLSAAGVMPIIFAQAIMFLPLTAAQWAMSNSNQQSDLLISLNDWKSLPYNLLFFILIVIFTYVYTALIVNPQQYAEYLKRSNAFIPGVKPGQDTQDYIDTLTTRITLPGAIFIGVIAILPAFVALAGVNDAFAIFFGGTSLLILVGVVLDTLQQVESYLLMRKYDGLVKSGRVTGRGNQGITIGSGI
ncbi:MAG: preprotein translocase subunit SecY [Saprospiraceae bacterium]|nr:preprotein translocase subunit SecY [Saprospiraceae bacterium]MBK6565493.1 preprotein translocase subunit SecY [Saprospiraceae bacterium]MBK8079922.1 preprotein translocase subunit SecY [Saprospiraceae bacterium]MBK8370940.1 preprotein translocase subunit SecY [Saprospiraceae bacterium]MBK8546240.1 preprotein translocase subunit SecY [Saprospiraceae bacterium]